MKVLMLSWEYPPKIYGGLGQHVFDLSRHLAQAGVDVHVITPRLDAAPDYEECYGVAIHRAGYPHESTLNFKAWTFYFNGDAIRMAVSMMNDAGPFSIVHAHDWLAAYAGRALARIFDIPLVTTLHATEQGRSLGLHNRFQHEINEVEKNLAREAGLIICCSRFMAGEIRRQFDVPAGRIRIIPNGVDGAQLCTIPEAGFFDIDGSAKIMVFLGRLVHEKGVKWLLDAYCQVRRSEPRTKLYICGQGPDLPALQERAGFLGVLDAVCFTGFISSAERNNLYQEASLAIIPSLYEPFGIVALEAMASGLPVVASDTGGLAEIIQHGHNGLKVSPGDATALAGAMLFLLQNPDEARRISGNARNTVQELYQWEAIAAVTKAAYQELIDAGGCLDTKE